MIENNTLPPDKLISIKEKLTPILVAQWQQENQIKTIRFQGDSMYPFLIDGDRLEVKFCKYPEISVGDIVLIYSDQCLFAHRIIDISIKGNETRVFEAGDNSLISRQVTENIIGIITAFKRRDRLHNLTQDNWQRISSSIARYQRFFLSLRDRLPAIKGRDFFIIKIKNLLFSILPRMMNRY